MAAFYIVYLAQNTSVANFNEIVRVNFNYCILFTLNATGFIIFEYFFSVQIRSWAYEAGRNVTVSVVYEKNRVYATKADRSNPYWVAISETFNDL